MTLASQSEEGMLKTDRLRDLGTWVKRMTREWSTDEKDLKTAAKDESRATITAAECRRNPPELRVAATSAETGLAYAGAEPPYQRCNGAAAGRNHFLRVMR